MSSASDKDLMAAIRKRAFSPMADARARTGRSAEKEMSVFGGFGGGRFGGSGAQAEIPEPLREGEEEYYERNTPFVGVRSFSDAYLSARKSGAKKFQFNGKEYSTEYNPNAKIGPRETESVMLNRREELDSEKKPIKGTEKYEPWVGQIPGDTKKTRKK